MRPIRRSTLHQLVEERLKRAIHLGDYLPGGRLPSERDLAKQLAVSRVTLREAIRSLEAEGYVATKRGATGGLTVTTLRCPIERFRRVIGTDLRYVDELFSFRRTVEGGAARLAASQRTPKDIARIAETAARLTDGIAIDQFRKADSDFHRAVARASGNRYFVRAIEDARDATFLLVSGTDYKIILSSTRDRHCAILAAIEAGKPDDAEAAMAAHIDESRREIAATLATLHARGLR
ncbi:MAG: FadR family transcriptional regulator [Alphaproteobacteria bacterium]|nr:FadR family transcriptional regulator [Alphaproteobacteria bacterium]